MSEAFGGYHFNVMHGINVDAGIFMSYVGLFGDYRFENWAYPSRRQSRRTGIVSSWLGARPAQK